MFQNTQLYFFGIIFNGLNWGFSVWGITGSEHAFGNVRSPVLMAMLFYAIYGLTISFILKRFGALVRIFINALAILCNAAVDYVVFGIPITFSDVLCFAIIVCATLMYAYLAHDYRPVEKELDALIPQEALRRQLKKQAQIIKLGCTIVIIGAGSAWLIQ